VDEDRAKRLNREKQARWRRRHRAEILAARAARRERRASEMARLNPWVADLAPLSSLEVEGLGKCP
jgi:hypothetical protein